jgi:NAD(P)-dependent dehydrogenase (short-subunit alcohol dehydrogenase family)
MIPLRRLGNPAEIVGRAVFPASDAVSDVNGAMLTTDGRVDLCG